MIDAFNKHLGAIRGLAMGTCDRYTREVRKLLERTCGGGLDLSLLTVSALRTFVIDQASRHSPRAGRKAATALRSFLRFLHLQGLSDGTLIQSVPTVRDTRRSTLPTALTTTQLCRLLGSMDRTRPAGLRDYAILMCLSQLGLRASEIAALTLDDIDWRAGVITIAISKPRRASVLPLPAKVGRAIASYLRRGRPATTERRVFVRHFFPVGAPLRSLNVTGVVLRAFRRARIDAPSRGALILRHTAATQMVRAGASLKAVADVLRHRSIDTTAVYTKVDLPRLREVALPWPQVRP
jgi:site-specific recombinase XerD